MAEIPARPATLTDATPAGSPATLVRAIGMWGLAAAIANATIGGGIFRLPSFAASVLGTAAPIAFVVCALAMGLIVMCMAEAGSRVAMTGGPYAYVEVAFGSYAGFITGVLLWLAGTLATASVANVFADNAANMLPGGPTAIGRAAVMIVAIVLASIVNLLGIKQGNRLNSAATIAKLAPLLLLVVVGAFAIVPQNLAITAMPSAASVTRSSMVLIFAFAGIESALVPSGEVKNPERTVPRAIFIAMAGIVVLYIVLQLVAQGVLGSALSTSTTPLADAAAIVFGPWGRTLLLVGVVISTFGYVSAMTLAVPRLLFAFGRDGFLPSKFAEVHPKWKSPWLALVAQGLIVIALSVSSGFEKLALLANVALLLVYFACAISSWQLRRKRVQSGGIPFRVPGAGVVPFLACAVIITLLTSITGAEWLVFVEILTLATIMFFATRSHRQRLVRVGE